MRLAGTIAEPACSVYDQDITDAIQCWDYRGPPHGPLTSAGLSSSSDRELLPR
jgi:hypothetical protein